MPCEPIDGNPFEKNCNADQGGCWQDPDTCSRGWCCRL
jgi:hypothetical protein